MTVYKLGFSVKKSGFLVDNPRISPINWEQKVLRLLETKLIGLSMTYRDARIGLNVSVVKTRFFDY